MLRCVRLHLHLQHKTIRRRSQWDVLVKFLDFISDFLFLLNISQLVGVVWSPGLERFNISYIYSMLEFYEEQWKISGSMGLYAPAFGFQCIQHFGTHSFVVLLLVKGSSFDLE